MNIPMNLKNTLYQIKKKDILIEIFGLGYVGFPLSIRLASSGFKVLGIDTDKDKISRLENNSLIYYESNFHNEFLKSCKSKKLSFSSKPVKTKKNKIGIICVPTPLPTKNITSKRYVISAVKEFLSDSNQGDLLIIESSLEIGTTEEIKELIKSNSYQLGENFGLCYCPERIDPLNKKWTLHNIPRVIYCSDNNSFKIAKQIYRYINRGKLIQVGDAKIAEVVKSFENSFRLVNISLVNELALLCDKLEINISEVLKAGATKPFGFMPFYSSAGAGGHCIPKDPTLLLNSSKSYGFDFKSVETALRVNEFIPQYISKKINNILKQENLPKSIIVCGLSYKINMDDMRDSPGFKIIKHLKKLDFDVLGYDPYFKKELKRKYLTENNMIQENPKLVNQITDKSLKKFSCLIIVQHHKLIQDRINEIYDKSKIPVIYDCQNKLKRNKKSNSKLFSLGYVNL
jgi:UDP-N-acetyl-D-glucosamine dehydrogenase